MYNKEDEVVECSSEFKEDEEEFVNSDDAERNKVNVCYVGDDGSEEEEEEEDKEEGEDVFGKMILEGKREIITQFNILKEKMINGNKHNKNSNDFVSLLIFIITLPFNGKYFFYRRLL